MITHATDCVLGPWAKGFTQKRPCKHAKYIDNLPTSINLFKIILIKSINKGIIGIRKYYLQSTVEIEEVYKQEIIVIKKYNLPNRVEIEEKTPIDKRQ